MISLFFLIYGPFVNYQLAGKKVIEFCNLQGPARALLADLAGVTFFSFYYLVVFLCGIQILWYCYDIAFFFFQFTHVHYDGY